MILLKLPCNQPLNRSIWDKGQCFPFVCATPHYFITGFLIFNGLKCKALLVFLLQVQNYLHTIWNRLLYVKECQCINDKYSVFIIIDDHFGQLAIPGKLKGTLDLTGYGSETYTCQAKSPTWPTNTGKDSCQVYTYFLCLLLIELCILSILLWST